MNPNSKNQIWSLWTITVRPPVGMRKIVRNNETVRANVSRFFRKAFGSASQCKIVRASDGVWTFQVRSEGHPCHDPEYVGYVSSFMKTFFTRGFGVGTVVRVDAKLEAGSAQNGKPSDQLIVLPSLKFDLTVDSHQ